MTGILGKKIGMTRVFVDGAAIPVTVIESGPCKVVGLKTPSKNGYSAIALAFGKKSPKKVTKSMRTVFEKAEAPVSAIVREFKVEDSQAFTLGQELLVDVLNDVQYVDISGISKGKGFQGGIKRHGFGGGPAAHGASLFHRKTGSIGSVNRVFPGKKMPGQMGNERVTLQNLKVVKVDKDNNLLLVKGAIPGSKNRYVIIRPALKKRGAL